METDAMSDRLGELEAVYREHRQRMWRALFLATGSSDISSEAVAEAFAQLLARGTAIRDPAAWVWRSAFKIATGEVQRQRKLDRLPEELAIEAPEQLVDLVRALRQLTPHQRTAVVLADYAGWSHFEVAKLLRSTPAAVAVHVYRARRRLRDMLEERDD